MSLKECLHNMKLHLVDLMENTKNSLCMLGLYLAYQYGGEQGLLLLLLAALFFQTVRYLTRPEENDLLASNINRVTTQTLNQYYDKLRVPTTLQKRLRRKLADVERRRKGYASDLEESLLIEEGTVLRNVESDTPNHCKLMLHGKINGKRIDWEVDSGSATSLISSNLFEKIPNHQHFKKVEETKRYTDFQGRTVESLGKYIMPLELGKNVFTHHAVLVAIHPEEGVEHALLGVDLIRSKNLGIDNYGNQGIYLAFEVNGRRKRLKLEPEMDCRVLHNITLEGGVTKNITVSVNPHSTANVINRIQISNTYGTATLPSTDYYHSPAESLIQLNGDGSFIIPVRNTTLGEITFHQGDNIGKFNQLPNDTLLVNPKQAIERIENGELKPDLYANMLKLRDDDDKTKQPIFLQTKPDQLEETLQFKYLENGNVILMQGNSVVTTTDAKTSTTLKFWENTFKKMQRTTNNEYTLNLSLIKPEHINVVLLAFQSAIPKGKLKIYHEQLLMINRIEVFNHNPEPDGDVSEEDLIENLCAERRIDSTKDCWKKLLIDVPHRLRRKIFNLLTVTYPEAVARDKMDFGLCKIADSKFKIELTDTTPIQARPYPLNQVYKSFINETTSAMLKAGLLEEQPSDFASGVFIRARPDHTNSGNYRVRIIYDLRKLNSQTRKELFPIPSIKQILQNLRGYKHFGLVDLKDAYQSIEMHPDTRHFASIVTSSGQYVPTRLGYGFVNAPSFFSKIISKAIKGIKRCQNYLDDIILTGNTEDELLETFEQVLKALQDSGFKISLPKINLYKKHIKILGMIVSADGIQADRAKTEAISKIDPPTTRTEMQRFLGTYACFMVFLLLLLLLLFF